MFRQEQKITRLTAQLNRVRLSRAPSTSTSPVKKSQKAENDELEKTYIKSTQSPIRPDHIEKLKKQLSGRKTIPVRSSPKVQTDLRTILTNRKSEAVENATQAAHRPANSTSVCPNVPRLNFDDSLNDSQNRSITFGSSDVTKTTTGSG